MPVDLRLDIDRPRADVFLVGDLDAAAAPLLVEAVDTVTAVGCDAVRLHLRGRDAADATFVQALTEVRRNCRASGCCCTWTTR